MMKKKNLFSRRILCLMCALLLAASLVPSAMAYGASSRWAEEELNRMDEMGLIPLSLQQKQDLRVDVTREEMCSIAVTVYESYIGQAISVSNETPFPDTDSRDVAKAYAIGVAKGYPDGSFGASRNLTRQEFCTFLYRMMVAAGWEAKTEDYADLSQFADADSVSNYAKDPMRTMVGIGLIKGTGEGLAPRSTTPCEQGLVMFYRAYDYLQTHQNEMQEPGFATKYPNMSAWAAKELAGMEERGLIPELLIGRDMSSPLTRKEMCYVAVTAYRALAQNPEQETQKKSPFSDVDDPVITYAHQLGLVNGYTDGTFGPSQPITREQFFKMTANFLAVLEYPETDDRSVSLDRFADGDGVSNYAKAPARLLIGLGLVKGNTDNTLAPKNATQCQQGLAMFYRSLQFLEQWRESSIPVDPTEPEPPTDPTEPPTDPTQPGEREKADELVRFALELVGCPYVYAGSSPETGFDCSGLVWYVFHEFDIPVKRTAEDQWFQDLGWEVELEELLPGDLVFFSESGSVYDMSHVGIYVGDGMFLHAANSARGVVVDPTSSGYFQRCFVGAKRFIE